MAKILFTGMTSSHISGEHNMYISPATLVVSALRELGHDVQRRPTRLGEDLDRFDRVFIFLAPPLSINTRHTLSALWAMRLRPDAIFALDDWQVRELISQLASVARDPEKQLLMRGKSEKFKAAIVNTKVGLKEVWADPDLAAKLVAQFYAWANEPWHRLVMPLFPWHDLSKFDAWLPARVAHPEWWDPSGYLPTLRREWKKPGEWQGRHDRWVLAAISKNQEAWVARLGNRWPMLRYGLKDGGDGRLSEPEVEGVYASSWGSVATPYYHAGSGWYRHRFVHAAAAGLILLADSREVEKMPGGHLRAAELGAPGIEALSLADRIQLASDQQQFMLLNNWSRNAFTESVERVATGGRA